MADPVTSVKDVFERHIPARLQAKPDVVAKIGAVYQFNISGPDGGAWTVDCTRPGGAVQAGSVESGRTGPGKPSDCRLIRNASACMSSWNRASNGK